MKGIIAISTASGAVLGLVIGIIVKKSLKSKENNNRKAKNNKTKDEARSRAEPSYEPLNLEFTKDLARALKPLESYRGIDPGLYRALVENADLIAGLWYLISSGKYETTFAAKALRYRDNIQQCIAKLRKSFKPAALPTYFEEDMKSLEKIANNYYHNISMELSSRIGKTEKNKDSEKEQ